jgi:peptidoglycan/LPS O-acetylase OafA/YrhL
VENKSKRFAKLEAIRGFAAVYVVLHHIFSKGLFIGGKDFSIFLRFGQEAVILFFVLSGFVIQYSYCRSEDKSFKTFFLKRFLRIYIPLTIIFIAHFLLLSISKNGLQSIDRWTFLGNAFMLQDMSMLKPNVICEPFLGNSPLWSLSYEWWFYMLFFFLVRSLKEKASTVVYIVGAVAALTYLLLPNFINRELMYLVIWWAGADMAKLYIDEAQITIKTLKKPLSALVLLILVLALNVKLHNSNNTAIGISPLLELRHFSFALMSILLAILWKKMKWIGFGRTLGVFEPVASISFGIYISHWFLIIQAHYLDTIISNELYRLCVYILICIMFSYVVERVIFIGLNRYILHRTNVITVESNCVLLKTTSLDCL